LKKSYRNNLNKLFIFKTADSFQIEAVFFRGNTLCISTQIGCPVGCKFCASGNKGFFRNLTTEEIIAQYVILKDLLEISGIAIAGIGEPSSNFKNVSNAIEFFKEKQLKVTITTTGFDTENFKNLLKTKHDGITLSIHGFTKDVRKKLFKKPFELKKTVAIFESHIKEITKTQRKKYQVGYLLLRDVNNHKEELLKLSDFTSKYNLTVMLMMYNKIDTGNFSPVSPKEYEEIFRFLRKKNIRVTLSNRFRTNSLGGCGTLTIDRK